VPIGAWPRRWRDGWITGRSEFFRFAGLRSGGNPLNRARDEVLPDDAGNRWRAVHFLRASGIRRAQWHQTAQRAPWQPWRQGWPCRARQGEGSAALAQGHRWAALAESGCAGSGVQGGPLSPRAAAQGEGHDGWQGRRQPLSLRDSCSPLAHAAPEVPRHRLSLPREAKVRFRRGRGRHAGDGRGHLPIQKRLNTAPNRSSVSSLPGISPRASRASRRSMAASSGGWPGMAKRSMAAMSALRAWRRLA